jgi:endonuclease-3
MCVMGMPELRAKYRRIADKLAANYGSPKRNPRLSPVDELISTILSQNTADVNRDRAFEALRVQFPTWEEVRDAAPEAVIEAIRAAGLANQKGPRIQAALSHLTKTQGHITLDHLRDMDVPEAKAWLTGMVGVGPKTAAIVLLFAMGKPAFPVDTHIHRVSARLGLIGPKTSAEKAHDELECIVPPSDFYAFHLQLIWHGRQVCHARGPRCEICTLQYECVYFREARAAQKPHKPSTIKG